MSTIKHRQVEEVMLLAAYVFSNAFLYLLRALVIFNAITTVFAFRLYCQVANAFAGITSACLKHPFRQTRSFTRDRTRIVITEAQKMSIRIQIDLDDEFVREIDARMKEAGLSTRKQYFEYSLALFEWAFKQAELGRKISALDTETKTLTEIYLPPFDRIKKKQSIAA
jgi:Arc/MetJ family transcription regulator